MCFVQKLKYIFCNEYHATIIKYVTSLVCNSNKLIFYREHPVVVKQTAIFGHDSHMLYCVPIEWWITVASHWFAKHFSARSLSDLRRYFGLKSCYKIYNLWFCCIRIVFRDRENFRKALHIVYDRNHYFGLGQIPVTDNLVTNSMGYFSHHKRAPKTKFAANSNY